MRKGTSGFKVSVVLVCSLAFIFLSIGTAKAWEPTTPLATGVPFNWKDPTPVARLALDYFVLWVNAESPYKSAQQYIDEVKKTPGKFNMGGTGSKQEDQIITVMMEQAFGLKLW